MVTYRSVGMDLGIKTTHEVVVMEPGDDRPRVRFRCGHAREDLEIMVQRVQKDLAPGAELRFVMEPTDTAWVPVATFLHEKGHAVYLVRSEMVKDQRKVLKKYAKTDQVDAATLASLPWIIPKALNRLQPTDPRLESLRRRVRQANKLSLAIGDRQRRIQALVRLAIPSGLERFNLFTEAGRALCSGHLDPRKVKQLGLGRLTRMVQRVAGLKTGAEATEAWYGAALEALRLYADQMPDYEDLQDECTMEFRALDLEREQAQQVRTRIDELYGELHPSRNLESIPGVGPYVAAVLVAAIGNPKRFKSSRKFRAYTGMVPAVSQSGETSAKGMPMSKAGPNWLKRALYLAAESARHLDPELARIYHDQMVKYGHHHLQAVCAVATHLADRAFVVYRDDRPYNVRDLEHASMNPSEGRAYIQNRLRVPTEVRKRLSHKDKEKHQLVR